MDNTTIQNNNQPVNNTSLSQEYTLKSNSSNEAKKTTELQEMNNIGKDNETVQKNKRPPPSSTDSELPKNAYETKINSNNGELEVNQNKKTSDFKTPQKKARTENDIKQTNISMEDTFSQELEKSLLSVKEKIENNNKIPFEKIKYFFERTNAKGTDPLEIAREISNEVADLVQILELIHPDLNQKFKRRITKIRKKLIPFCNSFESENESDSSQMSVKSEY